MHIARIACLVSMVTLVALPASARPPHRESGSFVQSSSDVEQLSYDAQGKIAVRTLHHYSADGEANGRSTTEYSYDAKGRRSSSFTAHTDAQQDVSGTLSVGFRYDARGRTARILRTWRDRADAVSRTEKARYEYDGDDGTTLVVTRVLDRADELKETRYSIRTVRGGKMFSSDTSVFNARGHQTSRYYTEWRGDLVERWNFDAEDEVVRRELEVHHRDAKGRDLRVEAEIFDGSDVLTGSRLQAIERDRDGRIQMHVTTWYDAESLGTQRRTVSHTYDGPSHMPTRRILWERWATE